MCRIRPPSPLYPTTTHTKTCSQPPVTFESTFPRPLTPDYKSKPALQPRPGSTPDSSNSSHPTAAFKPLPRKSLSKGTARIRAVAVPKKPSPSTQAKQKSVQHSLELTVERCKGFHPAFVPLARSTPSAPPSSPLLETPMQPCLADGDEVLDQDDEGIVVDYFQNWADGVHEDPVKGAEEEDKELDSG